ncbi:MAG: hypothetical protein HWE21_11835 [Cytophagia bacterium]|nr:hypothetical protein [Cytophagia bacterium]
MLNFLRNLRRSSSSKYLKYAIGEIVLVVIGILIALSINNWNEQRKAKDFQDKMLKEIYRALENDINTFESYEQLIKTHNESISYLIDAQNTENKESLNMDSLKFHLDEIWGFGVSIGYNNGPYESLKSSGLDKIENDSLRSEIAKLYSYHMPNTEDWINEIIRVDIVKKFDLFEELFTIKLSRDSAGVNSELVIEDYQFLDSPLFSQILDKSNTVLKSTVSSFQRSRQRMIEVKNAINNELE